jgi:hypothetical protein
MIALPEDGGGAGTAAVIGDGDGIMTWCGSPRLVTIKGMKKPSMAPAAQGCSGLHASIGGASDRAYARPRTMPGNRVGFSARPAPFHPEKIILSGKSGPG